MKINLTEIERCARAATPGPWMLATSNSWRRFVTKFDTRPVCEPVTYSERDRHPDLHFPNGGADGPDAAHIAGNHPAVTLAFCEVVKAAQALDAELAPVKFENGGLFADLRRALAAFQEVKP